MIRLAFLGVLLLGGLFAFGAFYLARGNEAGAPQIATLPAPADAAHQPAPTPPETPDVDRLYYLQDIAFDQGEITVLLFGADRDGGPLVIRDQAALQAARDAAWVPASAAAPPHAGRFEMTTEVTQSAQSIVQIYRRDSLIASLTCTGTICDFPESLEVDHAGLVEHATPYQLIEDGFVNHATYMDTILAVSETTDYMLLDQRPRDDFPAERRIPHLIVSLPTVVHPAGTPFDKATHEALLSAALDPLLPQVAVIDSITITDLGQAVLADKDNNQPVTAGGAAIAFPHARYFSVQAQISGITSLNAATYNRITEAATRSFDVDTLFAEFVTSRLQTTCVDCYFLKVDGPDLREARADDWHAESYLLNYYDLRDPP